MTDLWMPGAQRLSSSHPGGSMAGGTPRAVWHRTVGQGFAGNASYLKQEGFEPHILWDPTTGETGQFLAADKSAYALQHPKGTSETNRAGSVCIQIEVADHGQTWDITATAMKGWPALRHWLASLGIPEVWPGGPPPKLGTRAEVNAATWARAGHFSHSQVPHNTHTDPGHMDLAVLFAHAGDRWLRLGFRGPDVRNARHALHLCDPSLPEGDVFDDPMGRILTVFQQHRGLDEKGVGPKTWAALRAVPGVH